MEIIKTWTRDNKHHGIYYVYTYVVISIHRDTIMWSQVNIFLNISTKQGECKNLTHIMPFIDTYR